jgi:hypothetical protein
MQTTLLVVLVDKMYLPGMCLGWRSIVRVLPTIHFAIVMLSVHYMILDEVPMITILAIPDQAISTPQLIGKNLESPRRTERTSQRWDF